MRAYAYLGDALLPYQAATVELLNQRLGLALEPLAVGDLDQLEQEASDGPALLFLCGLPYTRARAAGLPLEAVAAPVSTSAPDDRPGYLSVLLGRPGLAGSSLDELRDQRLAINSRDSMSGWVLPIGFGMPIERFDSIAETGAHRRSLETLLREEADAAPIDSMLLAGELLTAPEFAALPVLAEYGPAPSPPVVLAGCDPELAQAVGAALAELHLDADGRAALALGRMARFDRMSDLDYDAVRDCDRRAAACTR